MSNESRQICNHSFKIDIYLRSFAGRSLLAMSTNDSLLSATNNELITKNSVINDLTNDEIESIILIRESNLSGDVSHSSIMTNQFKIVFPTYIEEKSFSEKDDIISGDTNELIIL